MALVLPEPSAPVSSHSLPMSSLSAPTHNLELMSAEGFERDQLGEHVSRLLNAVNGIDGDLAMVNVVPEVMVLDIDVLGAWSDLWDGGDLDCPTVVSSKTWQ